MNCDCVGWCRDYLSFVMTRHHRNCEHYDAQEEIALLENLILAMKKKKPTLKKKTPDESNLFIGAYCEAFKLRWNTNPLIGGKEAGLARQIVRNYGIERAMDLIQVFLQMDDPWFLKRRHSLDTFFSNIQSVVIALGTGRQLTNEEIRQVDKTTYNKALVDKIERGDL